MPLPGPWPSLLCPRELDSLLLHIFTCRRLLHFPIDTLRMVWDMSNSIRYPCCKTEQNAEVAPCFTKHHKYFVTGDVMRTMLGCEQLWCQGFPRSVNLTSLTDRESKALSGNTYSVPVVGGILLCTLANVRFGEVSEATSLHPPEVSHVGSLRCRGSASACDILPGIEERPKRPRNS